MNKNPKERTEYIGIRVTPDEKEFLKNMAATAGVTLTGLLLRSVIGDKLGEQIVKGKERKKNGKVASRRFAAAAQDSITCAAM